MTNGEKILIGILVVAVICVGIVSAINNENSKEKTSKKQNNISNMMQYIEESTKNENKENNIIENNTTSENEIVDENKDEQVVGKEEQESKQENVGLTNEQKAIKLAQDEWGISVSSYIFEAELQSNGTYRVTVRSNDSNRTTVTIYTVDVEDEIVTEE